MNPTARTTDNDIMHFAILAIGATAKMMGISDTEVHNRLKRFGLIQSLLFDCYDTLHTESVCNFLATNTSLMIPSVN